MVRSVKIDGRYWFYVPGLHFLPTILAHWSRCASQGR